MIDQLRTHRAAVLTILAVTDVIVMCDKNMRSLLLLVDSGRAVV
jgi:hypothetical protein